LQHAVKFHGKSPVPVVIFSPSIGNGQADIHNLLAHVRDGSPEGLSRAHWLNDLRSLGSPAYVGCIPAALGGRPRGGADPVRVRALSSLTTHAVGEHLSTSDSWGHDVRHKMGEQQTDVISAARKRVPGFAKWYINYAREHAFGPVPRLVMAADLLTGGDDPVTWEAWLLLLQARAEPAISGQSRDGKCQPALTWWSWPVDVAEDLHDQAKQAHNEALAKAQRDARFPPKAHNTRAAQQKLEEAQQGAAN
jgi:hypothetical protein